METIIRRLYSTPSVTIIFGGFEQFTTLQSVSCLATAFETNKGFGGYNPAVTRPVTSRKERGGLFGWI